jgi:hypothetical protein
MVGMAGRAEPERLVVSRREVEITNPSKVLFPKAGITKLDLARYFVAVADGALRGAGGRPCILKRYPNGIGEEFFFQKRVPASRPAWIDIAEIRFPSGRSAQEIVPRDAAALAWMANLACIELHPHPVRADDLEHPDELRVDLDPVPGVKWAQIRQVAQVVREVLQDAGLARTARRLHRLQPERTRPHRLLSVLRTAERRRARVGAGDLGRAGFVRSARLHDEDHAGPVRARRRSARRHRRRRVLAGRFAGARGRATIRPMKLIFGFFAILASLAAVAQPAERPNQPVYRSGPWFVVRSVRDAGSVVACTGFYRANRRVQLSKDTLIIKTPEEVASIAVGFDDEAMGASRPLSTGEKELKAIAFTGDDFAKLARSHKLRIAVETPQGTMRHELDLTGVAGALDNIAQGCPVPAEAPKPRRHRLRS